MNASILQSIRTFLNENELGDQLLAFVAKTDQPEVEKWLMGDVEGVI